MSRGKYIVLEGPEGVGKTTQILELARRLQAAGLPVRTLREPDSQSDLTARAIRQLTQDPRYPMNTNTEVLLYNAARSQSLQVIKNSVAQGVICLVDRNYLTTLAIQYYGRGDVPDYDTINRIISFAVQGVEPDLCIVLDAPVQLLKERAYKRGQGERFDNLNEAFLERVRAGYLWEAKQRDLPVVFATQDEAAIANEIWNLVTPVLAIRDKSQAPAASEPVSVAQIIEEKKQAAETSPLPTVSHDDAPHIPASLSGKARTVFAKGIEHLLALQSTLMKAAEGNPELIAAARLALPVAADGASTALIPSPDPRSPLTSIASQQLHETHTAASGEPTHLVSYQPRTELGLAADLLYEYTDLPAAELADEVDSWPYDKRAGVLQGYLESTAQPAIHAVRYGWEVLSDMASVEQFRAVEGATIIPQTLTPRYGYDVPKVLDNAGLAEQFEACFDASLALYSDLQAAGKAAEAQYAVLLGHRQRYLVRMSLTAFAALCAQDSVPSALAPLLRTMQAQAAEVHPLIGERLAALATRTKTNRLLPSNGPVPHN